MKPLGQIKTHSLGEGHQDCVICHPDPKNRKAKERRKAKRDIKEHLMISMD